MAKLDNCSHLWSRNVQIFRFFYFEVKLCKLLNLVIGYQNWDLLIFHWLVCWWSSCFSTELYCTMFWVCILHQMQLYLLYICLKWFISSSGLRNRILFSNYIYAEHYDSALDFLSLFFNRNRDSKYNSLYKNHSFEINKTDYLEWSGMRLSGKALSWLSHDVTLLFCDRTRLHIHKELHSPRLTVDYSQH